MLYENLGPLKIFDFYVIKKTNQGGRIYKSCMLTKKVAMRPVGIKTFFCDICLYFGQSGSPGLL